MGASAHNETLETLLEHAPLVAHAPSERDAIERLACALDALDINFDDVSILEGDRVVQIVPSRADRSHATTRAPSPDSPSPRAGGPHADDAPIALRTVSGGVIGRIRVHPAISPRQRRIACLLADIGARAIEALRRQDTQRMETVGRLVEGVAHDYNNLLTVIQGHAELAQTAIGASHPAVANVRSVEHAAQHARDVVASLLDFTRAAEFRHETLDLAGLIERTAPLLDMLTPSRVHVRVSTPRDDALTIRGSASRLRQLLVNLALNARDAMPAGGTITLTLERSGDPPRARLIVADTGEGMSEQTLARAMDPRFTTRPEGQGLGLSIVREIVLEHAGDIRITSTPAQGCSVAIDLPILEERPITSGGGVRSASPTRRAAA